MLQQQSATFLRHFLNRLLHYRQLRMNQGSQGCARHAAKRHILRNAQATLLNSTLGSQHSSLRKAKYRIKGHILLQETLHHPTTLFSRQCWRQDILRLILYMKLFQRIPIAPQSFIAVSDISRSRDMNNMLIPLAQQSLHHEKRHDVIVHVHL